MVSETVEMDRFDDEQKLALALAPKFTAAISVSLSCVLIWSILSDRQRRPLRMYHRLLLGISFNDILASTSFFMTTWPVPGTEHLEWAYGNAVTCSIQTFFNQLAISSALYNASLSIYYLLVVRYGFQEDQLQRKEWIFHVIPIAWGWTSSIVAVAAGYSGNASLWCWVTVEYEEFRWAGFYGPLWVSISIVTLNSLLIYLHVLSFEKKAQQRRFEHVKRTFTPSDAEERPNEEVKTAKNSMTKFIETARRLRRQNRSERVRMVATQSLLYAGAFYVNWLAITVQRLIELLGGGVYFPLIMVGALTVTMQGLPNFLAYLWPTIQKKRKDHPRDGCCTYFFKALTSSQKNNVESYMMEDEPATTPEQQPSARIQHAPSERSMPDELKSASMEHTIEYYGGRASQRRKDETTFDSDVSLQPGSVAAAW